MKSGRLYHLFMLHQAAMMFNSFNVLLCLVHNSHRNGLERSPFSAVRELVRQNLGFRSCRLDPFPDL